MSLLSSIKSRIVRKGPADRSVICGLYRGLMMEIDLSSGMQLYVGLWERETHPYIRTAAKRCKWAVDVGAGRGELCLYFLRHSSMTRIYAFEPQKAETNVFERNIALNPIRDRGALVIVNKFVGCKREGSEEFVPLDSLPLDRWTRGFVKIDVEGAELDVLRSGENLLAGGALDVLVETHSRKLEEDCLHFLSTKGFSCKVVPNAWWRAVVPEHRPIDHNRWLWATKG